MPEHVLLQDCPDGARRADVGCFSKGPVVKTTDYVISAHYTGTTFSTEGATRGVRFTLPPVKPGLWFTFLKLAASELRIVPSGTALINGLAALSDVTAGEVTTAITLVCDGVNWFIHPANGTWVVSDVSGELVTDGGFTALTDWTVAPALSWAITAPAVVPESGAAGVLSQPLAGLTPGRTYTIAVTIDAVPTPAGTLKIGDGVVDAITASTTGVKTADLVFTGTSIVLTASKAGFVVSLVSVVEKAI